MNYIRIAAWALVALLTGVVGGVYIGKSQARLHVVEGKVSEKIITRTITKVRIVRPDGTVEEKEVIQDKKEDSVAVTKETQRDPAVTSRYSLGLQYHAPLSPSELLQNPYAPDRVGVVGGLRLLGPLWGEVGIRPFAKEVSLGIRVEF